MALLSGRLEHHNRFFSNQEHLCSSRDSDKRRSTLLHSQKLYRGTIQFVWVVAVWIGEYGSFWYSVHQCHWPIRKFWGAHQQPPGSQDIYRVAIVADPQLTDWYSYKQKGLSLYLTELYTDLFMRRSFRQLRHQLQPDLVLFLGDILDGGRETLDDARFQKNLERFHTVFATETTDWNSRRSRHHRHIKAPFFSPVEQQQKQNAGVAMTSIREIRPGQFRMIENIPSTLLDRQEARRSDRSARLYVAGNHDIGFGDTIIPGTERRFKRVHGPLNYEIPVGNHSFVVLDTLSLSSVHQDIREEAQAFLDSLSDEPIPSLPRILFTHVPLYRHDSVYCGPEREQQHRMIVDERGEQYQNLISSVLTREILEKVRPVMVFSGDDHDWCEIEHVLDDLHAGEVTVPTFSFAQGVQHPGFALLSLYRPTETTSMPLSAAAGELGSTGPLTGSSASFAYQHCGLPVQLAIYRAYAHLLVFTLLSMIAYRCFWLYKLKRPLAEGVDTSLEDKMKCDHQAKGADALACMQQTCSQARSTATELSPTTRNKKNVFTLHWQNPPPLADSSLKATQEHRRTTTSSASPLLSTTTTRKLVSCPSKLSSSPVLNQLWATPRLLCRTVLVDCLHIARVVLIFYSVMFLYSHGVH